MNNRHQIAIPAQTLEEISTQLGAIIQQIQPYAVTLSAKERHDILKMGDKSLGFVEKANEFAHKNPDLIPSYVDIAAFDIDLSDARGLLGVLNQIRRVEQLVDDTAMIAGSEAFQSALAFYNGLLAATKANVEGAKTLYAELKERFPGGRPRQEKSTA
jgi:capsule polysaccharide export protein KpsC/LpsZ